MGELPGAPPLKIHVSPLVQTKGNNPELPNSSTPLLQQAVTELSFATQSCFQQKENFSRPGIDAEPNLWKGQEGRDKGT